MQKNLVLNRESPPFLSRLTIYLMRSNAYYIFRSRAGCILRIKLLIAQTAPKVSMKYVNYLC